MKTMKVLIVMSMIWGSVSCGRESQKKENTVKAGEHWNISVLIDLSNRIDTGRVKMHPSPVERDLSVITSLIRLFKEHLQSPGKGTFNTKDKFRIFFHPLPEMENIELLSRQLIIDLAKMEPKEKKAIYRDMEEQIISGLRHIYDQTLRQGRYEGSDIWGFMKEDVVVRCIEPGMEYRNVLVILTDGYLYWKHDLRRQGNRFNYIERGEPHL